MKQIKEYGVITCYSDSKLIELVNKWISNGWQPLGGVSISINNMSQAMVKYEIGVDVE